MKLRGDYNRGGKRDRGVILKPGVSCLLAYCSRTGPVVNHFI
jgi:hypothetical protein